MFKRAAIVFVIVVFLSPLMFLGAVFREANVSGHPVFSKENMLSALPLFGIAITLLFVGLLIPWGEGGTKDDRKHGSSESDQDETHNPK